MRDMTKQRLLGLALVIISLLIIALAMQGTTPEEKDITPALLLLPLGIGVMTTKKCVLAGKANWSTHKKPCPQREHRKKQEPSRPCSKRKGAMISWQESVL